MESGPEKKVRSEEGDERTEPGEVKGNPTMSTPGEEVILRTIWGLRPFREAFLDSHKALVRNKSSSERESMLRVQTAFAKAFTSIRHQRKRNQDRNRRRKEQKKKRTKRELKKNKYGKYVDNNVSDSSSEEEEGNSLVPCLDVSALKKYSSARTKNYSMDGRIDTSSSLYEMMYMLYHPPDEQSQSFSTLNSSGGESFVVNESDDGSNNGSNNGSKGSSTNRNNGTDKGTRSPQKRPSRKRARETWDLSNLFRHKVNVEWSTEGGTADTNNDNRTPPHLAAPRGATTLDSSALMSRTPRQRNNRKGNLLPDHRFRFWHVIDVGVMLDLHDEIIVQQESRDSMNDEQSKNKDREEEELGFREQAVRDVLKEEQEEAQKSLAEAMAAANAAALVAETKGRPQKDLVNDEKKQKFRDIYEQKIKRNIEEKTTTTTATTTTTIPTTTTATTANTFFCGGRENIIERITTDDDAKDRVRGHGDLSHVMRELLQLEAYEKLQKKGRDDDSSNLSLRPMFKLEMRPDILCIRLEWPSTKSLRTARMSINGKKFIWDTITMKHLHLYDCFDIIGGKRRDSRTPYNTKACTYTLTHVICSSLGMALDQKDHNSGSSSSNKNKKKRTPSSSSSSSSSSPSTYYGMSRIRKRKSVGEEKDAWKLISLGGDNMKDEVRYTSSNGDYNDEHNAGQPIPEAMRMIDLQKICHERKVYPEFLFFESNGPTPRDLRSQERRHRVSSSAMLDTSTPPSITTSRSSDGRSGGGYGTIAQSKGRYDDDIEKHPFGNTSMDVNWCEASCTIV